jgi:hypothetical protein
MTSSRVPLVLVLVMVAGCAAFKSSEAMINEKLFQDCTGDQGE